MAHETQISGIDTNHESPVGRGEHEIKSSTGVGGLDTPQFNPIESSSTEHKRKVTVSHNSALIKNLIHENLRLKGNDSEPEDDEYEEEL